MRRVIITNNKKVQTNFSDKAEVKFVEATPTEVFRQAKEIANKGGKMLTDPTRLSVTNYYRSIPFVISDDNSPQQFSLDNIETCLKKLEGKESKFAKAPVMASMHQSKDLEIVKKVVG